MPVSACAQADYPNRPIRFIAGALPGGATDILARAVGQKLGESLHQQVVVDNRPGANQIIAAELTAKSSPDGYTILMVPSGFTINPALYHTLPYDPLRDFSAIALVANVPNVLVIHPSVPARSVSEFIAYARSKPGQLAYGTSGVGSPSHLATALFGMMTQLDLTHVPYKGNSQTVIDLIGGHLQLSMPAIPTAIPHVRAGRLIALGVATAQRAGALPEIPTLNEAGVKGYEVSGWYGVIGPAGIPRPLLGRLNGEINRILGVPETHDLLANQGADPLPGTAEQFAATIAADIQKWKKVVAAAGIKAQ